MSGNRIVTTTKELSVDENLWNCVPSSLLRQLCFDLSAVIQLIKLDYFDRLVYALKQFFNLEIKISANDDNATDICTYLYAERTSGFAEDNHLALGDGLLNKSILIRNGRHAGCECAAKHVIAGRCSSEIEFALKA